MQQAAITSNVQEWATDVVLPRYKHADKLTVRTGRKYHKVVADDSSVYAFVDMEGNIYKAASWATPAKHARGNIFSDDKGAEALDAQGFVRYLA